MSIEKGILTYIVDAEVLTWGTFPEEENVVKIGNYCSLAKGIKFYVDGNHRYDHASTFPFYELGYTSEVKNKNCWGKGPPRVMNDVWIGNDAVIMSGVTLHDGCIVGANSVVTKDVPPFAIVAGNPAKIVKYRFEETVREVLLETAWWDIPQDMVLKQLVPYQHDTEKFIEEANRIKIEIENSKNKKKNIFEIFIKMFQKLFGTF